MELRNRVKNFLEDTGATIMAFCKRINISHTYFYKWIRGQLEFSDNVKERIVKYLDEVYKK